MKLTEEQVLKCSEDLKELYKFQVHRFAFDVMNKLEFDYNAFLTEKCFKFKSIRTSLLNPNFFIVFKSRALMMN